MKLVNILIGFVAFSVFMVIILGFAQEQSGNYETKYESEITDLMGDYNYVQNFSQTEDSSVRLMENVVSSGSVEADTSSDIISGGLAASRLVTHPLEMIGKVTKRVTSDLGVPPVIIDGIMGIFVIILILIVISLIMRKNVEA